MDRDLVAAARHGDQAAYMDLVRPRSDRLFAIALQILRDTGIGIDSLYSSDFEAFLADAMPIIESLDFDSGPPSPSPS